MQRHTKLERVQLRTLNNLRATWAIRTKAVIAEQVALEPVTTDIADKVALLNAIIMRSRAIIVTDIDSQRRCISITIKISQLVSEGLNRSVRDNTFSRSVAV